MGFFTFFKRITGNSVLKYNEVPSPFHSSSVTQKQSVFVIEDVLEYEEDDLEVEVTFNNGERLGRKSDLHGSGAEEQCDSRAKSLSQRLCEKISGKH